METQMEGYTLYVDGKPMAHFTRRPPRRLIALSRLKGIEIHPPPENVETNIEPDKNH